MEVEGEFNAIAERFVDSEEDFRAKAKGMKSRMHCKLCCTCIDTGRPTF